MKILQICFPCLLTALLHVRFAAAQYEHILAKDQPQQTYTVFNGKVYVHPKERDNGGFFGNMFSFDLFGNPLVQTVLGWTDSWFAPPGPPLFNDTIDPLLDAGPAGGKAQPNKLSGQLRPDGLNKEVLSAHDNKHHHHPGRPHQQHPGAYGQRAPLPPQPTVNVYTYPYDHPNSDVINSIEAQLGNLGSTLGQQSESQDRNFKATRQQHPKPEAFAPPSMSGEKLVPTGQVESAATPKLSSEDQVADGPCPVPGKWRWDGQVCIAVGSTPSWACRPDEFVSLGRTVYCRSKIYSSFDI